MLFRRVLVCLLVVCTFVEPVKGFQAYDLPASCCIVIQPVERSGDSRDVSMKSEVASA